MQYRLHNIDPVLKPFVKVICSIESESSVDSLESMRVLPDTCVELFINFDKSQKIILPDCSIALPGKSFVTSRMNSFMDVRTLGLVRFVSICFAEGGAYPFFPVSMHDIANQVIDLYCLWGQPTNDLEERIEMAKTMSQRVQLIQQYLIARLQQSGKSDSGIDFCIRQIRQANGQLSLDELASQTGISNRQLVRRFNQRIGLSPKEFARMTTFKNALRNLKKYPLLNLTEIAYESGYYDQAHFIHACRDYSGLTPGQLLHTDSVLY